jgi:hypothetical protein
VQGASFPQDFFSSASAAGWSLNVSLPGMTVTGVSCFVTNAFGNSGVFGLTVNLAMAAVALTSGSGTTGDAAVFDATGKIVDAGAAPALTTRRVNTTAPLTGGGDLSADRTLAISAFTGDSGAGGAKGAVPAPAVGDAAAGKFLKANGQWAVPAPPTVTHGFGATFDGAGSPLTAGLVAYLQVATSGTISAWNILVDAGACTIKVWKVAAGTAVPTAANSINTAGVALTTGTAIRSTTVTDFTTLAVAADDLIGVYLQAVSGATKVFFSVEM